MPKPQVLFQYPHTSHLRLPNDVALSEDMITDKLKSVFSPEKLKYIHINQIVVSIEVNESQSDNKFKTKIMVTDGDVDKFYEESGDDYAKVTNEAIHGFKEIIRKENDKRSEHK